MQDDERRHRRIADDRQRKPDPRSQRLAREQPPLVLEVGARCEALSGIRIATSAPSSGAAVAKAQTISKLDACRISSPSGGPSASPPQIASP